jgi:hypothetical protein
MENIWQWRFLVQKTNYSIRWTCNSLPTYGRYHLAYLCLVLFVCLIHIPWLRLRQLARFPPVSLCSHYTLRFQLTLHA